MMACIFNLLRRDSNAGRSIPPSLAQTVTMGRPRSSRRSHAIQLQGEARRAAVDKQPTDLRPALWPGSFPFRRSTREVSLASAHFAVELFSSARVISLSLSGGWRESSAHPGCDGQRELAGFVSFVSALAPSSPATSPGTPARRGGGA